MQPSPGSEVAGLPFILEASILVIPLAPVVSQQHGKMKMWTVQPKLHPHMAMAKFCTAKGQSTRSVLHNLAHGEENITSLKKSIGQVPEKGTGVVFKILTPALRYLQNVIARAFCAI